MDISSLKIAIDSRDALTAKSNLENLNNSSKKAAKQNDILAESFDKAKNKLKDYLSFRNLLGAFTLVGVSKQFITTADSMNLLDARLKLATKSLAEYTSQQKALTITAKESYTAINDTITLFTKLNPALSKVGATTAQVNQVVSTFIKGLQLGGASATESSSAILQFSQAMGSGVLRGEEFNAMAEASPKLLEYLAKGLGRPQTELRKMAEAGELTAVAVSNALLKMSSAIDKDFATLPVTSGKALTSLGIDLKFAVRDINTATGASKALSDAILEVGKDVSSASQSIIKFYKDTKTFIDEHNTALSVTGDIVKGVATAYIAFAVTSGVATGITAISTAVLGLRTSILLLQTSIPVLGWIAGAVGVLAGAYVISQDDIKKASFETVDSIDVLNGKLEEYRIQMKAITDEKFSTDASQKSRKEAIQANIDAIEARKQAIETIRLKKVIESELDEILGSNAINDNTVKKFSDTLQKEIDGSVLIKNKYLKLNDELKASNRATAEDYKALKDAELKELEAYAKKQIVVDKEADKALKDKLRTERKLLEDWNKDKVELAKETLLSSLSGFEQESLKLQIEHKDQLEKYSSFVGAKEIIDANYFAKKDSLEKEKEFSGVQDSLNLYAQRVELIDNEYDREIELNNVRYANATTQLAFKLQNQEIDQKYYDQAIANENLLFDKTIEDLEKIKDFEINISFNGFDDVSNGLADIGNSFVDLMDRQKELKEQMIKYPKDATKLILQYNTQQIGSYGDVAGAIAGMTKSSSKEYEILTKVQKTMYMTQMAMQLSALATQASTSLASIGLMTAETAVAGTAAIAKQAGAGDPYTAFARVAAMAGLLASFGILVGGALSSSSNTTTSDAFSSTAANTGTGSVLGDVTAQSESIANSLEILEDLARPEFRIAQQMAASLESIDAKIGGMTSLLIQQGGFAFGEGANEFDTGYKNNLSGIMGSALNPASMLSGIFSKIPVLGEINGLFSGIMNTVLGGLFGKTSVSQSLKDSGISFADAFLKDAKEKIEGSAYQTISTTVSKKSWFSKSSSTSVNSYFTALDDETERQFSLVLNSLYNTVTLAGEALDSNADSLENQLNNFVVKIGKISLKGKTGDQIQETLTAIFGKIGDDIAKSVFPLLVPFQKVGEGMFETMTRVSTGMEQAEYYISRLGKAFDDIAYTDILNPQGDVGFNALLQSIIKTDESLYGLDNNLVNIIGSLNATAEELYGTYTALDTLRDTLIYLGLSADGLSFSSIRGAGSVEALSDGISSYLENFTTDSEQLGFKVQQLQDEFNKLNVAMPTSKEGFTALIESLDLSTESGQEMYGSLIILSETFADVTDELEDNLRTVSDAFSNMGDSLLDTINKLISNTTDSSNATQLEQIEAYWNKRDSINQLLAKDGDLTASETTRMEGLLGEINSLALNIQGGGMGATESLVSDLSKLSNEIDFDNQILKVYIVGSDIEKETGVLTQINGSHANGLANVPFDGYIAELHKGERVMTSQENNNSNNRDSFLYDKIEQMNRYMKKMSDDLSSVIRGNAMQTRAL